MRRLLPVLVLVAACATVPASTATFTVSSTPAALDSLGERLRARVAAAPGAEVAVYFRDFARADSLLINADVSMHAASTMKLPVLIELYRRVDAGTLTLGRTLMVENRFASIVDGSPYTLDKDDDSDAEMYARIGGPITIRNLAERMITRSSNFATNLLIGLLDPKTVNATAHALGARSIQVLRGVEDTKAFQKGLNNTTTARDLGVLLAAVETQRAASQRSCRAMRNMLMRQEFNEEIPAGWPAGTPVAHKTGWITGTLHDAAIVYPKGRKPYVLVVLTRKIEKEKDAQKLIADLSRLVYDYTTVRAPAIASR
jgi:beta-lactamase class A